MSTTLRVALFALLVLVTGLAPRERASAGAPVTAWYWALSPAPAPPYAGEGTLLVEGRPTGPTAVATVRATVPAAAAAVSMVLRLHDGSVGADAGAVVACLVTGDWRGGGAQPWAAQPAADCADAVRGVISSDGATMTFGVTPLVRDGVVDVLLMPGAAGASADAVRGSTFSAVFDQPDSTAFSVTNGGSSPSETFDGDESVTPAPSFRGRPAMSPSALRPTDPPMGVSGAPSARRGGEATATSAASAAAPADAKPSRSHPSLLVALLLLAVAAWRSDDVTRVVSKVKGAS